MSDFDNTIKKEPAEKELAEYVGMWAETTIGYTGIITRINNKQACLIIPSHNREQTFSLNEVYPREDLPRAWNPDGTPPPGEWQTAKVKIIPNDNATYDPEKNTLTGDAVADPDHEPHSAHDIRRWISTWESIQKPS